VVQKKKQLIELDLDYSKKFMEEVLFAIFYQEENKVIFKGNGIMISPNGVFITAGHIFGKNREKFDLSKYRIYKKIDNEDKFYKIKHLSYHNSKDAYLQKKPTYIDLAIGQIENYSSFSYTTFNRGKLKAYNKLHAMAYMRSGENNFGVDFDHINNLQTSNTIAN
jgi:hypothetical protein